MQNRLNLALNEAQRKWLKQQAKKHGVSVVEVIRRMLDKEMTQ